MKQKNAYKLLAAFMILTMIIVPMAYVATSPRSDLSQENQTPESQQDKYNPELWTFNQPFNSISDALNITPPGATSASYVDLDSMTPQMTQWAKQEQIIGEVDSIYKSNTTKMYYANLGEGKNNSFLLLSTMSPEKNDFNYMVYPQPVGGHNLLIRQEQGLNGLYNIMGTPVVLAPADIITGVLNITTSLNKTATAYDQYNGVLSKIEPAPFQTISSNVSFAKQYYMGIGDINGSYERTSIYLNISSSTMKKLDQLKANSTQDGLMQYNITKSGNYTIVRVVSPDLLKVMPRMEEAS